MIFKILSLVFLLIALVFLILANVTLPVTSVLKLGSTSLFTFGIFGYCDGSDCIKASYPVSFGDIESSAGWLLSATTRNALSKTFIVAPIATGINFFAIVMTLISLFADTTGIMICSLVFTVISFIATALIAVMVILVFHPNVAWTGWLLVGAAAATLVALPLLFLSIRVHPASDVDSQVESEPEKNFGAYGRLEDTVTATGFTGGAGVGLARTAPPTNQFYGPQATGYTGDDTSSFSKDYSRPATAPTGYTVAGNESHSSLFDSNPKLVNDITKPNANPNNLSSGGISSGSYYEDAAVNINEGPSTPISAKQKMAPSFVPKVAIPSNTDSKDSQGLPYPTLDRGSAAYSGNYGVFDHHPNVEGHQPFTELGDNDGEQHSLVRAQHDFSDDDSDFTSVSQRPPNVMYTQAQAGQPGFQQRQPVQPAFQQLYQQNYANVSQFQPHFQQNQTSQPSSFYGSESVPASSYGQQFKQTAPQYSAPMPPPQSRQPRGPTASDNALSSNPDFAIGFSNKRKQFPLGARYNGVPVNKQNLQRPHVGSRDGPYNVM